MLTYEEMLICQHELAKRGWRYFWYHGTARHGYYLLARKYPPLSVRGQAESPITITRAEQLKRYLHP